MTEPQVTGQTRQGVTAKKKAKSNTLLAKAMRPLKPRIKEIRSGLRSMRKSPLAIIGLAIVIGIVVLAFIAPWLAPTPAGQQDPLMIPRDFKQPMPPGAPDHPWGSGAMGTDIYYGVIWGARTSIVISLFVVLVATIIGTVVGAFAGYYGGKADDVLMRVTDVFLSIPGLVLAMAVAAILLRSLDNIMLSLIIVWWPPYARLVRGQVLSIRENTYVEAAKAVGVKKTRILFRHILPNSVAPLLINITMDIGVVVLVAAALSYIGYGPPAGTAEWGKMISDAQPYFRATTIYNGVSMYPYWTWFFPGVMIFLFVMGFNLLGDALRDILDPKSRK
jgi:peptide/nickel transport system permease protein